MNKERFAKLIQAVEERPEELFDMEYWGRLTPCGTTCCAFGSYIEANPDRGFSLQVNPESPTLMDIVKNGDRSDLPIGLAAEEFDICYDDAEELFCAREYVSKSDVLSHLREYMNTH